MSPLLSFLAYVTAETRRRTTDLRQRAKEFADARGGPDQGGTAENVVIIALLVVLALGALAIITTKVLAKANSINLN